MNDRKPDWRAVRTLTAMMESERARADARQWIKPADWPDEAALRIAATLLGEKLKPASAEVDALEVRYYVEMSRCQIDGDALAEMMGAREQMFAYGRELSMLADRLMSGKVGTLRQAFQETIDAARAIQSVDFAKTARLTADSVEQTRPTDRGGWGWSRSEPEEVAA